MNIYARLREGVFAVGMEGGVLVKPSKLACVLCARIMLQRDSKTMMIMSWLIDQKLERFVMPIPELPETEEGRGRLVLARTISMTFPISPQLVRCSEDVLPLRWANLLNDRLHALKFLHMC
ncbi:hypothetical protein NC651_005241 [Populus alba x Populus x berolinensis]|nr:hypothetical protein NC651_005241 [Populus alba x Populus x berolinensis]